ncbi:MAG: tRNA pseudouridine(38-40) synthase TruA [Clostridia bacterium]|nr:tRNA pseudouridine(38-40) synthase TruA [Clostridia bacterium]
MSNFKMQIMYDGGAYHGWQRQNNGITVQEVVENTLSRLTGEEISVTGCSRTDAGVHALSYTLNFFSNTQIPPNNIPLAFNNLSGHKDIIALDCKKVSDDFSARFSCQGKTYLYKIWNSKIENPFTSKYSWFVPYRLNVDLMKEGAKHFVGTHDFAGFMAQGGSQKTTVRTVKRCEIFDKYEWDEQIALEIEADAYLYNMVRIITGTLVECGMGKIAPEDLPEIIAKCDRTLGGMTAPPEGLFLKEVNYKF